MDIFYSHTLNKNVEVHMGMNPGFNYLCHR